MPAQLRGLACPSCGGGKHATVDSRPTTSGDVRRRKVCDGCRAAFTTYETIATDEEIKRRWVGGASLVHIPDGLVAALRALVAEVEAAQRVTPVRASLAMIGAAKRDEAAGSAGRQTLRDRMKQRRAAEADEVAAAIAEVHGEGA